MSRFFAAGNGIKPCVYCSGFGVSVFDLEVIGEGGVSLRLPYGGDGE
ncbi:hypothetical protein [Shewanella sp.]|nr:hypothetical protein [Shewanella sp.]NRB25992.1 hypothetical protein [Shewanella sp.]